MSGLLDIVNDYKRDSTNELSNLAKMDTARRNNNDQIAAQRSAQKKQAVGSAIGTGATVAMMSNPVTGALVGGAMLLGSLF
jgi:hypothetical protein